jgi:hypothetical protein
MVGPISSPQLADDISRHVASNWPESITRLTSTPQSACRVPEVPTLPTTNHFVRRAPAISLALQLLIVGAAAAGPASDTLLPKTTKGYVSVARAKEFDDRWNKTQLGQMFNDEVMKAFVDDFKKQIREDFGAIERKLGLTYDDLKGVSDGEMSLSLIERKGKEASLAVTIDVTGRQKQADDLLASIEKRFAARKGRRSTSKAGDTTLDVFNLPGQDGGKSQQTIYFIKDNLLVGIDDRTEAEAIIKRFSGGATDNLKSLKAYQATMEKCQREAGKLEPEARWFIDPFGFIFADRTLHEQSSKREQDMAKILYDNGFDAVEGAGGYLNQLVEGHIELLARSAVYAPPVKENDPLRWKSSMRMMQMPNGPAVDPQSWAPRELASYLTLNLKLTDAFDNVGPLVDAIQEHEDAWKNSLDGWKNDPYGPQVDVRKEFIENMSGRVTLMSSYDTPISEDSERAVFAIEAKDEKALAKTLEKWMAKENGNNVKRHQIGQYVIFERVQNATSEPDVEVPGFTENRTGSDEKSVNEKRRKERVLPNSAVTVALGHLIKASDVKYLTEILQGFGQRDRLASSADYKQMQEVMNNLAPGEQSAYQFGRSDEEVRPTFDLLREGKMPQSKSMLGKLLNKILTTADEKKQGLPRRQRINGANLPEFETVRRYFGPHAAAVRSDKDGWFVTSVLLNKEAP